jgi:glycosyltransferase involved in cell wall biosynthesis
MTRVSVGMPVYNGARHVREAILSLLNQTFTDFELIISDNASTDETGLICEEFARRDSRIRYYRNTRNMGAAANYNRVFALSNAEYFKWAAHDDICGPAFLEKCVQVLDNDRSVVLCYPKAILIDEVGDRISDYDDGFHLVSSSASERLRAYFTAPGVFHPVFGVIRRPALERTPLIANYVGSDLVLLAQLALSGKFHEVDDRLFGRREHLARSGNLPINQYARWWNPDNRGWWCYFPRWRWLFEYCRAIKRADISTFEKYRCCVQLSRWAYWEAPRLIKDASTGIRLARRISQES